MSFFGISEMELVVILLVALLVFGPERMLDMARKAGRFWREARATIRYAIDTAMTEEEKKTSATPAQEPVPGPEDVVARPNRRAAAGGEDGGRVDVATPDIATNGHLPTVEEDALTGEDGKRGG